MSLRDRVWSAEMRESMGIELVSDVVKRNRARWLQSGAARNHFDWGGGGGGFIESPEYAIFIKLPEFY